MPLSAKHIREFRTLFIGIAWRNINHAVRPQQLSRKHLIKSTINYFSVSTLVIASSTPLGAKCHESTLSVVFCQWIIVSAAQAPFFASEPQSLLPGRLLLPVNCSFCYLGVFFCQWTAVSPLGQSFSPMSTLYCHPDTFIFFHSRSQWSVFLLSSPNQITPEMVAETWTILLDKQLWKAKYTNKQDAMAALDNAALQDIRRRVGGN